MKKMTLSALALASVVGLGLAGTAQAAESQTNGIVGFDVDWTIQPPTTGPEIVDPEPGTGSGDKDLSIIYAMNFNFGADNDYNGTEIPALDVFSGTFTPKEDPETSFEGALGVSIGNSGNVPAWYLYANASEFTGNGKTVSGLTMTINDIVARPVVGPSGATTTTSGPVELTPENDQLVASYTNDTAEPGMSITNIAFGDYTGSEKGRYDGVQLMIPAGKAIEDGVTYTSVITWTLAEDPIEP